MKEFFRESIQYYQNHLLQYQNAALQREPLGGP